MGRLGCVQNSRLKAAASLKISDTSVFILDFISPKGRSDKNPRYLYKYAVLILFIFCTLICNIVGLLNKFVIEHDLAQEFIFFFSSYFVPSIFSFS